MTKQDGTKMENNEYERCWVTGDYDEQDCEECPHKDECSGYDRDK